MTDLYYVSTLAYDFILAHNRDDDVIRVLYDDAYPAIYDMEPYVLLDSIIDVSSWLEYTGLITDFFDEPDVQILAELTVDYL